MITVRRAVTADAAAILALTTWLSTSFVVEDTAFRKLFAEALGRFGMCVLVAESGGGVIGYLMRFDHGRCALTAASPGSTSWAARRRTRGQGPGVR